MPFHEISRYPGALEIVRLYELVILKEIMIRNFVKLQDPFLQPCAFAINSKLIKAQQASHK